MHSQEINLRGKPLSGFAERQNLLPYTLGYLTPRYTRGLSPLEPPF